MISLVEDLHRCRRLVASMRSQVLAPTFKRQTLAELVAEIARRQEAGLELWRDGELTPRKRYQHARLARCARSIQWCWRSYCRRRRIREICELEQKWNERRGIRRFLVSVLKIQSIFRGYRVRKHARDKQALQRYLQRPRRLSVLFKFKGDRAAYQIALKHLEQDQAQLVKDREYATKSLAYAELVVASCKKTPGGTRRSNRGGTPMVLIDASLLDGSVVRMEPRTLVAHWMSELDRLDGIEASLQERETMIKLRHPVLHAATSLIQAAYRGNQHRRAFQQLRRKMRRTRMRLVASSAWCEARMNVGLNERREQLLIASVTTIAGIYRVHCARKILRNLRQERAAHVIYRTYWAMQARVAAKKRVDKKRKHHQRDKIARHHATTTLTRRVWSTWCAQVVDSRLRDQKVHDLVTCGKQMWLASKASCIATWWRAQLTNRETTRNLLLPQISPSVLEILQTAINAAVGEYASAKSSKSHVRCVQDVFSRFREMVLQLVWQWREPHAHLYMFAHKHNLQLDEMPLGELWVWIGSVMGIGNNSIDLLPPLLPRALVLLADFSRFHTINERVERQAEELWNRYEAMMVMREYLAQLLSQDLILEPKALDFKWRERAASYLRDENQTDRLCYRWATTTSQSSGIGIEDPMGLFRHFHSQWGGNLCEKCFMLQPSTSKVSPMKLGSPLQRKCQSCGHRHYERSTASKPLLRSDLSPTELSLDTPGLGKWVGMCERFDFFVANAFLHALAPAGSSNREHLSSEELWRAALEHTQSTVAWLTDRHDVTSLDSLLSLVAGSASSMENECIPLVVSEKLQMFTEVFIEQLHLVRSRL